ASLNRPLWLGWPRRSRQRYGWSIAILLRLCCRFHTMEAYSSPFLRNHSGISHSWSPTALPLTYPIAPSSMGLLLLACWSRVLTKSRGATISCAQLLRKWIADRYSLLRLTRD